MTEFLSRSMRDCLIRHIDQTRVAILRNYESLSDNRQRVIMAQQSKSQQAALKRGWLKRTPQRDFTVITESGRAALAAGLADWADALARVGASCPPEPLGKSQPISQESTVIPGFRL